jgi:superfamily II DNA or RNA helicase
MARDDTLTCMTPPEQTPARPLRDWIPDGALRDPEAILDRFLKWVASKGLEPYAAQEEALLELMTGSHVVLSTPTGSGKSLVALGLHFKGLCEGRRSFYTAPIKALASEKFFALCDELGPESVGMLTGDASINWGAPVICCTAEVLANMAVRQGARADAPLVVMDEFHYYGDPERGAAWEIPLLALPRTQFLLMSATLGNTAPIEERIAARTGRAVAHVHSDERPVPLDFEYAETPLHETIERLLEQDKAPIYVVCFTQRAAAEQAQALTSAKVATREERQAVAAALGGFRFDSPYGKDMSRILRHGVGLHHAGLLPKYRLLVEQLAQRGLLKVICGTDTLGVGVNVPIRTVLFTQLSKFDGTRQALLTVRDFKQIAGRAGRKGFDEQGSVVCQAPEHVIENARLASKATAAGGAKQRKLVKRKPPRHFVAWGRDTFEQLTLRPSEPLVSRFAVSHGLLINCLLRGAEEDLPASGYRALLELIEQSHTDDRSKRRLRRESAALFRSLRSAEILSVERGRPARVRIDAELQRDFSLHHSLSLYLVEAIAALDVQSETFAFDVLSLVEAILEDPRAILYQQERRAKDELMARLKAERVPYDERMNELEKVSWPRPNETFVRATFELFRERHPWVRDEDIRPKGIAREMAESYAGFDDFVKRNQLARMEGLLLRYLSQVWNALAHNVPSAAMTEELHDLASYLRATVTQVDSSLVSEWESMVSPSTAPSAAPEPPRPPLPEILRDERAFRARVRAECHRVVRALASRAYDEAAHALREDDLGAEPWTPERLELALAPFYEQYDRIVFEPRARASDKTLIKQREPRLWEVHQSLVDDRDDEFWSLELEVDLRDGVPDGPILALLRVAGPGVD